MTPLLAALLLAAQAEAAAEHVRARLDTVGGELQLVEMADGAGTLHRLRLGGRAFFDDDESARVEVDARFPATGPARLALLALATGGSGCPSFFMVVEVEAGGAAHTSPRFGNCSPRARARYVDGVLTVDLPAFGAAPAARWSYAGGALREVTARRAR